MERLEPAIRHHLAAYLAGALSLDEFTAWLVAATWNIGTMGDAAASDLAYSIELALAEHSSGLLTLDELRAELQDLNQHANLGAHPVTRAS